MEISIEFSPKPKLVAPFDSAVPFEDIFLKELKARYHSDTCVPMIIAAWLVIAKT